MAQGEAAIIRRTLWHLRHKRPIFSHGIVHDALFIHKEINDTAIQEAFHTSTNELGVSHMRLAYNTWDATIDKYHQRLNESEYNPQGKLDLSKIPGLERAAEQQHDLCAQPPRATVPRSIWDTHGVYPKS